eukprot:9160548-Alexandrium_andersonii.AAC.1
MDDLAAKLYPLGTARPLVLLGDFNARLFHRLDGEEDVLGPFPLFSGVAGPGIAAPQDMSDPGLNRNLL